MCLKDLQHLLPAARALAFAHGHTWAGEEYRDIWDDETLTLEQAHDLTEKRYYELRQVSKKAPGLFTGALACGITGPTVLGDASDPVIYHATGTGRLEWNIRTGMGNVPHVSFQVSRPGPGENNVVLMAWVVPREGKVIADPYGNGFGSRHLAALEKALEALLGLYPEGAKTALGQCLHLWGKARQFDYNEASAAVKAAREAIEQQRNEIEWALTELGKRYEALARAERDLAEAYERLEYP